MSRSRGHRIIEATDRYTPPPRPGALELTDAGELVRHEVDGSESVLVDAATGEPVLIDELAALETISADSFTPTAPTALRRLSLDPTPTTSPAVAAHDGAAFARAGMTPAQLERLERRDARRGVTGPSAPASAHASTAVADGRALARSSMTPEQIARLEARDRRRK